MPLTDTAIRNAKPLDKPYKLSDAQGLYLLIKPNGSKLWHLKYRFGGKEKKLAFGAYPTVSLASARKLREEARTILSAGDDPGVKKQHDKQAKKNGNTFEAIARQWVAANIRWSEAHAAKVLSPVSGWAPTFAGLRHTPPKSCVHWNCTFSRSSAMSLSPT
ncbi:Arm DNA-binding domain-containing protein [Dickeya dianthicola]|uniref:Arm DNA-binding domain-containing protein n=1 Tax=Dickeya dianthicola TaxID=204039 RepID=UPI001EE67A2C|nr:Arm DNA-binding domain-containing protein [Dickeya dianthicola]